MTQETFGARLKRLRERLRLTQWELGERCGVTGQSVGQWELGHVRPTAKQFPRIASALGVTTYYLRHGRELSDVRLGEIERRMRLALHDLARRSA